MSDVQTDAYASAIGKLIQACGKAPRERVIAALSAFGVAEERARESIERGFALGFYVDEPATGSLRAPQKRRDSSALIGTPIIAEQTIEGRDNRDVSRRLAILRLILSTLPAAMWAIDREGYYVYYEGKALEAIGLTDGFCVGQNFYELFSTHESADYIARAFKGESVHTTWGWSGRFFEHWCFPIRNAQGEIDLAALVSLDVTEATKAEAELRARLETIEQQQRVIRELSTPIIEVWDKVLALPLLGAIDSARAAAVMTSLLAEVVGKGAEFVLLDLTGVESVDTATASYMLDLIRAVRLLGAEGIITGIRPSVAQTMITLGVGLEGIVTHANLRQGLQDCLRRRRARAK
ncbi:STAS domain-containing protein [Polyangium aurulentum]|uniref:STAS domain-containing protein n=1 Tax=Polyangium aurulentum TaxID=2567896 RepID=UPI0010AE17AD|nr:STAS domain-containing protein [Polyangium aurulentum]UQA56430.1 PAS domain-containing protein [Polyangium aurulentum]